MKKKEILQYAGLCFTFFLLMAPNLCSGSDMEVLAPNLALSTIPRHEGNADMAYNPVHNEFMVVFRTTGPLSDDCDPGDDYECTNDFNSLDGLRISPDGEIVGDPLQLSPPEVMDKGGIEIVRNTFTNEFMLITSIGTISLKHIYIGKIDSEGNLLYGFERLYEGAGYALLPDIVFNPVRRDYVIVYNDDNFWNDFGYKNNVGFIVNEDGILTAGPFEVGNQVGTMYAPWGEHNSTDDTYLFAWEDFRHADDPDAWYLGPNDIYGALLDGEGNMIAEVPIMDDSDEEGLRTQWAPSVAYNSHRNEFLVTWTHQSPLDNDGAIAGKIIGSDGTPKGPEFLIASGPGAQSTPAVYYIEEKQKYFLVFGDGRNFTPAPDDPPWWFEYDMYARWLDGETALPIGDEIAINIKDGRQALPKAIYNPVMDRFLIAWRDWNVSGEYPAILPEGTYHPLYVDTPSNMYGAIYGSPSFLSGQVIEKGTGDPVGNTKVLVLGPSLPVLKETNEYGWFNIVEDSQPVGKYLVVVLKFCLPMAIQLVDYAGDPLRETIEMNKWW